MDSTTDHGSEQSAAGVLMIRPQCFSSNHETLASNGFQSRADGAIELAAAARGECDALAAALMQAGVAVHIFDGNPAHICPDEVFPNNWVSFHGDGTAVLYPMMAPGRRLERRLDILDALEQRFGYRVRRIVDLSELERRGQFLEGTGSLVLDRRQRVAYACLSPRTDTDAVRLFADRLGYRTVVFEAFDQTGRAIYHTNVLMSVGTGFAVVCADAIADPSSRRRTLEQLRASGREIIEIGFAQMSSFAANLLELRGRDGPVIALSERALAALAPEQRDALAAHGQLVTAAVETSEKYGGGGVRCMLAEVHLPRRQ